VWWCGSVVAHSSFCCSLTAAWCCVLELCMHSPGHSDSVAPTHACCCIVPLRTLVNVLSSLYPLPSVSGGACLLQCHSNAVLDMLTCLTLHVTAAEPHTGDHAGHCCRPSVP
jgi:hypothetical protein